MQINYAKHAAVRAQQRGFPPFVDELLDRFGQVEYTGQGCIVKYLDKSSIRSMESELGKRTVSRFAEWLDAYKVCTTEDKVITIGHRTKRIWRK